MVKHPSSHETCLQSKYHMPGSFRFDTLTPINLTFFLPIKKNPSKVLFKSSLSAYTQDFCLPPYHSISDINSPFLPTVLLILPSLSIFSGIGFSNAYLITVDALICSVPSCRRCWPVSIGYDHAETSEGLSLPTPSIGFLLE